MQKLFSVSSFLYYGLSALFVGSIWLYFMGPFWASVMAAVTIISLLVIDAAQLLTVEK